MASLSGRQQRELAYHREMARRYRHLVEAPVDFEIVEAATRRWWNAHWSLYTWLMAQGVADRSVLVVGCGFGDDALYLARAGARVRAFDLSPECLEIAEARARRAGLDIAFSEMPAETLAFDDAAFDLAVARDILHHVDIPAAMREIRRVLRPGGLFAFSEIYSHSLTHRVRGSRIVERWIYPRLAALVKPGERYVTEDERKLDEHDVAIILASGMKPVVREYYNVAVGRVLPDRSLLARKADRTVLRVAGPAAAVLGGRVLMAGPVEVPAAAVKDAPDPAA